MRVIPLVGPALVVAGAVVAVAYARFLRRHNEDWFLFGGALAVGLGWLAVVAVNLGTGWSWFLPYTVESHRLVGMFTVLSYPFWFWLGAQGPFLLFGRGPSQGGVLWLYRIEDRTEEFDPPWRR